MTMEAMNDAVLTTQARVAEALSNGRMNEDEAIEELVKVGFSRPLALDFVSIILRGRGE